MNRVRGNFIKRQSTRIDKRIDMDISVIIINYNTRELTGSCLDSIFEYTTGVSFEVILVDNASTDGSKDHFKKDSRIVFVESESNLGFGRANNLGATYASGEYYLFLNSDTLLKNNALKIFLDAARCCPEVSVGGMGCLLQDEQGNILHSFGSFTTPVGIVTDYIKSLLRLKTERKRLEVLPGEVDYICGADLFIPRKVFNMLGGFDPTFFMYYEENDLQRRMALAGYKRYIIDGPSIIHLEGASYRAITSRKTSSKRINSDSSLFKYIKKYYSPAVYVFFRSIYAVFRMAALFNISYSFKERMHYINFLLFGK